MATRVPSTIKSSRAQVLGGVSYAKDQTLTKAQVKALPRRDALLSSGRLYATPDIHGRRPVKGTVVSELDPRTLNALP